MLSRYFISLHVTVFALAAALGAVLLPLRDAAAFVIQNPAISLTSYSAVYAGNGIRYTISLDPQPAQHLAAGATQAHRTLLQNSFAGWTFNAGAAAPGTLTINRYDVYFEDFQINFGGAWANFLYENGQADNPTNLRWIQIVDTNRPLGGNTSPYVDPRPNDDTLPFYWTNTELPARQNPAGGGDLLFTDRSRRHLTDSPVDWDGYLYLTSWDGATTVTIHDGIHWGFAIVSAPSAAPILVFGLGLIGVIVRRRKAQAA